MAAVKLARIVASGFGLGFAPLAPGTFGSLAGVAVGALLLAAVPHGVAGPAIAGAAAAAIAAGLWAIAAAHAEDDPGWVVIDEVAGQLVAMAPLARPAPLGLLTAFVLFRLLDITKPGPIGWADRRHDALGVMGDDVIAGVLTAALLWALGHAVPALVR